MTQASASMLGRLANRARTVLYRLILLNYRRAARLYWELRARDLLNLYAADRADYPTLRDMLARYKPQSVLDVGCGNGRLFPIYIEAEVPRVLGIDISARALAIARRQYMSIPVRRARIEDLPPSEQYDLVIANRVLQHLPPENLALAVGKLSRIAQALIYVNEVSDSEQVNLSGMRYIFKHDYEKLFAENGWRTVERDTIPGTRQTYITFAPQKSDQEPVQA